MNTAARAGRVRRMNDAAHADLDAQGFALQAVPGLLRPRGPGAPGTHDSLHELLKKDVDHARLLAPAEDTAMAALLASCESMLNRVKRAAVEGR